MKSNLLLLHGALGSKAQFDPLIPLLKVHYQVHTLDFSGHGNTKLGRYFTIQQFAQDVIEYMDGNSLESTAVFGYSMGGYVGLYLMTQSPNRIKQLVTLGTKLDWNPQGAAREVGMLNADKILEKVPAFAEQLKRYHPAHDWRDLLARTAELMLGLGDHPVVESSALAQTTASVVMGWGSKDQMVTQQETRSFVEALPHARFELLEGIPHPIEMIPPGVLTEFIHQALPTTN